MCFKTISGKDFEKSGINSVRTLLFLVFTNIVIICKKKKLQCCASISRPAYDFKTPVVPILRLNRGSKHMYQVKQYLRCIYSRDSDFDIGATFCIFFFFSLYEQVHKVSRNAFRRPSTVVALCAYLSSLYYSLHQSQNRNDTVSDDGNKIYTYILYFIYIIYVHLCT